MNGAFLDEDLEKEDAALPLLKGLGEHGRRRHAGERHGQERGQVLVTAGQPPPKLMLPNKAVRFAYQDEE